MTELKPCPLCKSTAGKRHEVGCSKCPVDECGRVLLPRCPFCGTPEPEVNEVTDPYMQTTVYCTNDDCGAVIEAPRIEQAIIRWNRRPSLPEAP